jgi:hypothetical protein
MRQKTIDKINNLLSEELGNPTTPITDETFEILRLGLELARNRVEVLSPYYISYKGSVYEKLDDPGESVNLDFTSENYDDLKSLCKDGGYLSIPEMIRDVFRKFVTNMKTNPESVVKYTQIEDQNNDK